MKYSCKFILALVGTCQLAISAGAAVWLDDTWADGTRTNQNLPTDSAWFCSTAASLTSTTNAMSLAVGSGSVMALTYFTANTNVSIQLTPGDTLLATFRLTFTSVAAANSSQGFKIGVFDFADSTLSPKRRTADTFSTSSQGAGVQGYALFQNMGAGFNNSSPIDIRKRTGVADTELLSNSTDWTSLGTGPGNTNTFPGFVGGMQYVLQLSLQRTDTNSLLATVLWLNTSSGATLTTSIVDAAATNFNFDGIALRPSGSGSSASTIAFNEVKIEVVAGSTPPSIDTQPSGQTVLQGQTATFSVVPSGTPPFGYQWFYDSNILLTGATNATLTLTNAQPSDAGNYFVVVNNSAGSVTSAVAVLTVTIPTPPSLVSQPQSQTALPGETVTVSVSAGGTPPLTYQWFKNDTNAPLPGANDDTLTLANVQAGDAGNYFVVVANAYGSVTSSNGVLSVNTNPVAPVFTSQPASILVLQGHNAVFTANVFGTAPISYQWSLNGSIIPGATFSMLTLTNVQLSQAGGYTLVASNSVGTVTSQVATLTVTPPIPIPLTAYNLVGFGRLTTGGGILPDTDPNYARVYTATDLAVAINSKTVKIIEIMNDLNLGYNEIEPSAKTNSEPFRAHTTPKLHPVLLQTGVSLIDVQKKNGLTIFSAGGATIRHATLNIKNSANVIVRNLKFDEMWEWDEASKGDYDKNDWDFIDLGNSGTVTNIWIDHCTFTKSYDGIVDIKSGSYNITFSWNRYMGDDGASNTNSFVRQQIYALETNRSAYAMYNFLRNNGFSVEDIVTIIQGHDKTHLIGATTDPINAQHSVTFHHQWYANPWDRLPRLRGGNIHNFNIYVDDTLGLAAKRLRDARLAAMSTTSQNTLNNTYSFNPFLNGTISTESGAILVEKSVYIDCLTPLRNNQTDPSNPTYTGKIMALDTIYQMDDTVIRGNSTDPGNPLGPFQAPPIAFSWNLPGNQLPYSYTMDDPIQLQAMVTDPAAGAGAGVLTWAKTNWLKTSYSPSPPIIVAQPQGQTVAAGQTATFIAVAGGSAPLTYQWYFNTNSPLPNATNALLTLNGVQGANAGTYSVAVSNSVGSTNSAFALLTVTTSPTGFAAWQSQNFSQQQLTNPAISGASATPAGDGVPNLVKYALGLAPFVPAPQSLVSFRMENGAGVLSYSRPANVPDVTYRVEVSLDLVHWTATGVTQQNVGTSGGLQTWEARFNGPTAPNRFFHLLLEF
jgi:pectate lyase